MDYVVALCAPGYVVCVAEGVDLQRADVAGEEHEILCGGGEHVPWIEVEDRHEEVKADGGSGGYDEVGKDVVAHLEGGGVFVRELPDDDVEGCEGRVRHDDAVDDHAC